VYIRQWVPELSQFNGQAIHAPWEQVNSNSIYLSTNYPKPMIDLYAARTRALGYYKQLKNKDFT
jgi:deoxyribodipyrimidine photo-lyase